MIPTRKVTVGMNHTLLSRSRRRVIWVAAGAALAVPISMIGGSANVVLASGSNPTAPPVFSPFTKPVPPQDGASGASPHDSGLSPALLHNAGNQAALLDAAGPMANVPSGPLGIPGIVLQAYMKAQQTFAVTDPGCHLPWYLLAGIGKIESSQAENGEVDAQGNTLRPILGPVLDGTNGSAAIPATALSYRLTGDPTWQRAVGPMQFLPSTWVEYGGNGNPSNIFDAAMAAGRYLCNGGRDLSDPAQQAQAVFSYNHSNSYVAKVLVWANAYARGVTPLPETPVPPQQLQLAGPPPSGVYTPPPPTTSSVPPSTTTSTGPASSSSSSPTTTTTSTTTTSKPTTTTAEPTTTSSVPPTCTSTSAPTTTTTTSPSPTTTTTTSPAPPTCGTSTSGDGTDKAAGSTATPAP